MTEIILASSSFYRRQLLDKLGLPYRSESPEIDETPLTGESAKMLSQRLAVSKAREVGEQYQDALIIGSDQAATVGKQILGKPGSKEKAIEQLHRCSGQKVSFWTGLALLNSATAQIQQTSVRFNVYFRELSEEQICRYIDREMPLDCAGSFKAEGLGIALFKKMEGDDPNSLIGLPLIQLVSFLEQEGVEVL